MSTTLKALADAGYFVNIEKTDTGFLATARSGRSGDPRASISHHVEGETIDLEATALLLKALVDELPTPVIPSREDLDNVERETVEALRARFPAAQLIRVQIVYAGSPANLSARTI